MDPAWVRIFLYMSLSAAATFSRLCSLIISPYSREYPDYRFHALHYPRKEFLDLALQNQHIAYHQSTDYVDEMLFSLANLYVASEAQAFVGTLSSNWCMMVSNPFVAVSIVLRLTTTASFTDHAPGENPWGRWA